MLGVVLLIPALRNEQGAWVGYIPSQGPKPTPPATWGLCPPPRRCQVVAPDLRGHGETRSPDDADLAAETLAADVAELWHVLAARRRLTTPLVLVGHSMGGAVAVWAARRILEEGVSCCRRRDVPGCMWPAR